MRHAIYATPAPGSPLAEAGARWLGRDAFTDAALAQPVIEGVAPADVAAFTAEPRRYGFHGTLKPPFALADGSDAAMLEAELRAFAAARPAFVLSMTVAVQDGFLALVPAEASPALEALAADCVAAFDRFRAPPEPADLDRRRAAGLTPRQEALLARWGYPYVLEEFRFHMTLTGRLDPDLARPLAAAARAHFAGVLAGPVAIDTLGLFMEPARGAPFTVSASVPLGAPAP